MPSGDRFAGAFVCFLAVDLAIAVGRWWGGASGEVVAFGLGAGVVGSLVLAGLLSAGGRE